MAMTNSFHSSGKGHAIGGSGKLSSVQRHNERGYFSFEYDATKIHSLIGDVSNIVHDVKNYINEKFQPAVDEYNEHQKRNDRKITKSPYQYFCNNKKLDIANETIFQLGDKNFWAATRIEREITRNGKTFTLKDFPPEVKKIMDDIFLKQAIAYENIYETHGEEIKNRILQDYSYSKKTMAEFSDDELVSFGKLYKMKEKQREPHLKKLSEEQLEKFARYMAAANTIDFVEDKRLLERIMSGAMTINLINLTSHFDEFSPHAHGISVCSVKGYESGLNERVAKAVVLNKWALSVIQDRMHEIAEEEMAKHPDLFTVPLEAKLPGRNYDYYVAEYKTKKERENAEAYKAIAELEERRAEHIHEDVLEKQKKVKSLEDKITVLENKASRFEDKINDLEDVFKRLYERFKGLLRKVRDLVNNVNLVDEALNFLRFKTEYEYPAGMFYQTPEYDRYLEFLEYEKENPLKASVSSILEEAEAISLELEKEIEVNYSQEIEKI